jgi:hypothetical protein
VDDDAFAFAEVYQDDCQPDVSNLTTWGTATDFCDTQKYNYVLQGGWASTLQTVSKTINGTAYCNVAQYTLTYAAEDLCENKDYKTRTLFVYKSDVPVFNITGDLTSECTLPAAPFVTAASICGHTPQITDSDANTTHCRGSMDRVWTYSASSHYCVSNTTTFTQSSYDNTPPTLINYYNDTVGECTKPTFPLMESPQVTDNCDSTPDQQVYYVTVNTTDGFWTNLTYEAHFSDDCGNNNTHTWTADYGDTIDPYVTPIPSPIANVSCEDDMPVQETVTPVDACTNHSFFSNRTCEDTCSGSQKCTDFWEVCDLVRCVNYSQSFYVNDDVPPAIFMSGFTNDSTIECNETVPTLAWHVNDTCDASVDLNSVTASSNTNTSTGEDDTEYTITWDVSAADSCGNSASAVAYLHVNDTHPPEIDAPDNTTVECHQVPLYYEGMLTATDNCDANVTVNYAETTPVTSTCACNYTLHREWDATDLNGNEATDSQYIVVQDTTPPTIHYLHAVPATQTVQSDNIPSPPAISANTGVYATDLDSQGYPSHLSGVTLTITYDCGTSAECAAAGVTEFNMTWTWSVTDACGHTTTESVIVFVEDTTPPQIDHSPDNKTVECSYVPTCDPVIINEHPSYFTGVPENITVTVTITDATISIYGSTAAALAANVLEVIKIVYTAQDHATNPTTHTYYITVMDSHGPDFSSYPADETVECDCDTFPVAADLNVVDNCDGVLNATFTQTPHVGSCDHAYTLERTWTATDSTGHTETHTQNVTVEDNEGPTFLYTPEALNIPCHHAPDPTGVDLFDFFNIYARDSCDPAPTVTYTMAESIPDPSCLNTKTQTYTWTAMDDCGNTNTFNQVITITDNEAPLVTAGTNQQCVNGDGTVGKKYMVVGATSFTADDNCDGAPIISYQSCNGTTTDATNQCGNLGAGTNPNAGIFFTGGSDSVYDFYYKVEDSCSNTRTFKKRFFTSYSQSTSCSSPIVVDY